MFSIKNITPLFLRLLGMLTTYVFVLILPITQGTEISGVIFYIITVVAWMSVFVRSQYESRIYNEVSVKFLNGYKKEPRKLFFKYNINMFSLSLLICFSFQLLFIFDIFDAKYNIGVIYILPLFVILANLSQLLVSLGAPNWGMTLNTTIPSLSLIIILINSRGFFIEYAGVFYFLAYLIPTIFSIFILNKIKFNILDEDLIEVNHQPKKNKLEVCLLRYAFAILQQVPVNAPVVLIGFFSTDDISILYQVLKFGMLGAVISSVYLSVKTPDLIKCKNSLPYFLTKQISLRKSLFNLNLLCAIFILFGVLIMKNLNVVGDIPIVGVAVILFAQILSGYNVGFGLYMVILERFAESCLAMLVSTIIGAMIFFGIVDYNPVFASCLFCAIVLSLPGIIFNVLLNREVSK